VITEVFVADAKPDESPYKEFRQISVCTASIGPARSGERNCFIGELVHWVSPASK
jgi:hypothetical protein